MSAPEAAAHSQHEARHLTRVSMPHSEQFNCRGGEKRFSPLGSSYRFSQNKSQNGDRLIEHLMLSNHSACRSVFSGVQKWVEVPSSPDPTSISSRASVSPRGGALGALIVRFFLSFAPLQMVSSLTSRWVHGPVFCMSRCLGKRLNQAGGLPFLASSTL